LLRDLGFCATDLATADADFERTAEPVRSVDRKEAAQPA